MAKITYVDHPPATPEEIARQVSERRRRDRVAELDQGFTFRADGRLGYIYYREGDKLIELMWEMSGRDSSDIILFLDGLRNWATPTEEAVTPEKQTELEQRLREWLNSNRVRAIIQPAG